MREREAFMLDTSSTHLLTFDTGGSVLQQKGRKKKLARDGNADATDSRGYRLSDLHLVLHEGLSRSRRKNVQQQSAAEITVIKYPLIHGASAISGIMNLSESITPCI